jgi:hypothetical protein
MRSSEATKQEKSTVEWGYEYVYVNKTLVQSRVSMIEGDGINGRYPDRVTAISA